MLKPKAFIDHEINSIQNYLAEDTRSAYQMTDANLYQENLVHTKMLLKDLELENYLFSDATRSFSRTHVGKWRLVCAMRCRNSCTPAICRARVTTVETRRAPLRRPSSL